MSWGSTGTNVDTNKQTNSLILFNGIGGVATVRQFETVETMEVRGLDSTNGKNKVDTTNIDSTTQTTYWKHINGRTYSFTATTGSRKEKSAARRDESGQWVYTETTHTFTTSTISDWSTTELDGDGNAISLSAAGQEAMVSIDKSVSRIAWDVFQTVSTTVKEFRRIDTEAHANSVASSNTTSNVAQNTVYRHQTINGNDMTTAWAGYMSGTEKFASARYCGAAEGWTVTVTQKDYNWSSPTAAASGDGWRATA